MNLARARRRWAAWNRWELQVIALCGEHHKAIPGEWQAYNERAFLHNSRNWGRAIARRFNRRTTKGARR